MEILIKILGWYIVFGAGGMVLMSLTKQGKIVDEEVDGKRKELNMPRYISVVLGLFLWGQSYILATIYFSIRSPFMKISLYRRGKKLIRDAWSKNPDWTYEDLDKHVKTVLKRRQNIRKALSDRKFESRIKKIQKLKK